ncbi:Piso0_004650 [Millerozyma farinosa CBS 7064]|uniref:Chitin biosynthesis protein CHS5 n=1 Tax=Pichia sorbitophila (strain ATCC MYA-4447 / BCRC 22081 / CBS 7064 / NBRC 10061 / NRRL Y-12695) TaxID=559304 RepID=G8Y9D4_PICSO|nr:Piso0_004650 [Millerozyma farinosa CBS 7064]CCE85079.1 Piso0_004650 [Millerozyma farinosa CBS 7064]
MVEVSLTVGKLDASLALLLTKDHHLIEFPTILLPNGVRAGSIVKIKCDQDIEGEKEEAKEFQSIQDEILSTFGKDLPKAPKLLVKNVTQTSCVLEWDDLHLGTASLKNLVLFKDGKKLGAIPSPLTNKTTKLSGLPIDKTFQFQLQLGTTAGTFSSDIIEVTTHKMTDLSGINVCLGDISPNEQFSVDDIEEVLKTIGAHSPQKSVQVDTTHFICTRENKNNPEYVKANEMNIPIIRPEWLKACERERRIVGVRDFYVKDCILPDIFAKNYWKKERSSPSQSNAANDSTAEVADATQDSNVDQEKEADTVPSDMKDDQAQAEPVPEPAAETADDTAKEPEPPATQQEENGGAKDEVDDASDVKNLTNENNGVEIQLTAPAEAESHAQEESPIEPSTKPENEDKEAPTVDETVPENKQSSEIDESVAIKSEPTEPDNQDLVKEKQPEDAGAKSASEAEDTDANEKESTAQPDESESGNSANKKKKKNNKKKNKKK